MLKILAIILLFLVVRIIFKTLFSIERNTTKDISKDKKDEIIDVEYEELE